MEICYFCDLIQTISIRQQKGKNKFFFIVWREKTIISFDSDVDENKFKEVKSI